MLIDPQLGVAIVEGNEKLMKNCLQGVVEMQ